MSSEPEIGRASFLPAILPHMFWFSLAVSSWFFGDAFEAWEFMRNGLHAFSFVFGSLLGITLLFDFVAQYDLQTVHLNRQAALIAQIKQIETKPAPEPHIEFPPERFVTYLWNEWTANHKMPTVDECVKSGFTRQLVCNWFQELEQAGAVEGRAERMSGGDFVWEIDRLVVAARKANTVKG